MMTKTSLIISIFNLILYMVFKYDPKWFLTFNYLGVLVFKSIKNYRIDMLRYVYIFELKLRKNHLIDLINVIFVVLFYYKINNNFGLNVIDVIITYTTVVFYLFYVIYYTNTTDQETHN